MKKWIVTCNCNQKNTNTPPEIITVELEAETYEDAVVDGVKEIASRITKSTTHAIESIINNEIVAVNVNDRDDVEIYYAFDAEIQFN